MATSSRRDVRLGVGLETTGQESIRRLADEVSRLAAKGGEAAPEFNRLAVELDRLAEQAAALGVFKTLAADIDTLAERQREAAAAAADAAGAYAQQSASVDQLKAKQAEARAEFDRTQLSLSDANNTLRRVRAESQASADGQRAFAKALQDARVAVADQKQALEQQRISLASANRELEAAEKAERALAREYRGKAELAAQVTQAYGNQNAAAGRAREAAEALGVSVHDLAAAEAQLLSIQQQLSAGVDDARIAAAREQAEADRLAAVEARGRAEAQAEGAAAARAELAAIADTERFLQQYAEAARKAAAAQAAAAIREDAAAMRALEQAASQADAEMAGLVRSLERAEAAAREFTAASEAAAAAGADDAQALDRRRTAAAALIEAERALSAAQREEAASRDVNRAALLSEAQALLTRAKAADESRAATQRLVAETRSAQAALDAAFGATGVRSLQAIEAEIVSVERAMSLLQRQYRAGAISGDDLARATGSAQVRLATLKREIETIPALPGTFERLNGAITGLINRFGALTAAVATVGVAARPVIETEIALQRMERVLTTVTGSSESAARQIEFLRQTSQRAGQSFNEVGESYSKFAASALQSGLSIQQVQRVFANVAVAAGNLGLSSDQAKRALEALSQIASKGVVNMEELRQQLGDALPGVLPLLAQQLGVTQQQLIKLIESGRLLATEAIPAIADSLAKLGPQAGQSVSGIVAEWNRFKNVVSESLSILTSGAFGQAVGGVSQAVLFAIQLVLAGFVSLTEGVTVFGKKVGTVVAAIVSGDFKNLSAALDEIDAQSSKKLTGLANRIRGLGEASIDATQDAKTLGGVVASSIRSIEQQTAAVTRSVGAHQANAAVVSQHAAAQTTLAASTQATAVATGSSIKSLSQLVIQQQESLDKAVNATTAASRLTQARKSEAEALKTVAELSGDEIVLRQASADASELVRQALEAEAAADAKVADLLRNSIRVYAEEAAARGASIETINAQVEKLTELAVKKDADAEKSRAAAEAAKAEADQRRLVVELLRDNTSRYVELRQAVEGAQAAINAQVQAFERGKATMDDIRQAAGALARAKNLLRDAINDTAKASERSVAALKADAEITRSKLQLDLERQKTIEREANLLGQEAVSRQAVIRQREIELELAKLGVATRRAEADEIVRSTQQQLEELRAKQLLTPELENELDLRIKSAKAKSLDTQASEEGLKALVKEIELLKRSSVAIRENTSARNDNLKSRLDQNGLDSQGRNADGLTPGLASSASSSLEERNRTSASPTTRYDSGGFALDAGGQRITGGTNLPKPPGDGWEWVADLNGGWPYGGYWKRGGEIYSGTPGNQPVNRDYLFNRPFGGFGLLTANPGSGTFRFDGSPEPYDGSRINTRGPSTQTVATATAPAASTTHTVNITLGGRTTTVSTASAEDAQRLTDWLRELEDAAGRGG